MPSTLETPSVEKADPPTAGQVSIPALRGVAVGSGQAPTPVPCTRSFCQSRIKENLGGSFGSAHRANLKAKLTPAD